MAMLFQRQLGAVRNRSLLSRRALATVSSTEGTHDDFKTKFKEEPVQCDVDTAIQADIAANAVFVYMKGVPGAPSCGFSDMVCRILDAYGVRYGSRNVLADPAMRDGIKKFSNWPTIPQVFVRGEFVGGADILRNMHECGDLGHLLDPVRKAQESAS